WLRVGSVPRRTQNVVALLALPTLRCRFLFQKRADVRVVLVNEVGDLENQVLQRAGENLLACHRTAERIILVRDDRASYLPLMHPKHKGDNTVPPLFARLVMEPHEELYCSGPR